MTSPISLTMLRHGRSLADDERVHEGRYDSPLTAIGKQQLQVRADQWLQEGRHFDLIIASTLQRAQKSAEIIATALSVPLELDADWREMDNGPLARLTFEEAERLYPTPVFRNPYQPFCGSGESGWQLYTRAVRALESVIQRGAGTYLVVAHGMILNAALGSICGTPPTLNNSGISFSFGDAGFVDLRYHPDRHRWQLFQMDHGF